MALPRAGMCAGRAQRSSEQRGSRTPGLTHLQQARCAKSLDRVSHAYGSRHWLPMENPACNCKPDSYIDEVESLHGTPPRSRAPMGVRQIVT